MGKIKFNKAKSKLSKIGKRKNKTEITEDLNKTNNKLFKFNEKKQEFHNRINSNIEISEKKLENYSKRRDADLIDEKRKNEYRRVIDNLQHNDER